MKTPFFAPFISTMGDQATGQTDQPSTSTKIDQKANKAPALGALSKPSTKIPLILSGSAIAIIVLGIAFQKLYHDLYVMPLAERTLAPQLLPGERTFGWRLSNPTDILSIDNGKDIAFSLGFFEKHDKRLLKKVGDAKACSYESSDGETFGTQKIRDGNLTAAVKWIIKNEILSVHATLARAFDSVEQFGIYAFFKSTNSIRLGSELSQLLKVTSDVFGNYSVSVDMWGDELPYSLCSSKDLNNAIFKSCTSDENDDKNLEKVFLFEFPGSADITFTFKTRNSADIDFFTEFSELSTNFGQKFDDKFGAALKNLPPFYGEFAKTALSNMLTLQRPVSQKLHLKGTWNKEISLGPVNTKLPWPSTTVQVSTLDAFLCHFLTLKHYSPKQAFQSLVNWLGIRNQLNQLVTDVSTEDNISSFNKFHATFFQAFDSMLDQFLAHISPEELGLIFEPLSEYGSSVFEFLENMNDNCFSFKSDVMKGGKASPVNESCHVKAHLAAFFVARALSRLSLSLNRAPEAAVWTTRLETTRNAWQRLLHNERYCDLRPATKQFTNCDSLDAFLPIILNIDSGNIDIDMILLELSKPEWLTKYGILDSEEGVRISLLRNYYVLQAAYNHLHYSDHKHDAHQLFGQLRNAITGQLAILYKSGGVLYDGIDATTGKGTSTSSCSALVGLILADKY